MWANTESDVIPGYRGEKVLRHVLRVQNWQFHALMGGISDIGPSDRDERYARVRGSGQEPIDREPKVDRGRGRKGRLLLDDPDRTKPVNLEPLPLTVAVNAFALRHIV